jgi:rhomboid family GlyGly-CTERM serine protease
LLETARCARCDWNWALYEPTPAKTSVLPLTLSCPERAATALALAVLVLHALGAGDLLEYRADAIITQPWRGLTGHLVHVSWAHALVNAAGLIVVARLYAEDLDARLQVSTLLLSAVAITAVLAVVYPTIAWYRGLSGALHGLFFAGAATWLISEDRATCAACGCPCSFWWAAG